MIKGIDFEFGGRDYFLVLNGMAMMRLAEIAPDGDYVGALKNGGTRAICEEFAVLAECGELARRYLGYAPREIVGVDELLILLRPSQAVEMMRAVVDAINLGFESAALSGETRVVDLGLAKIEAMDGDGLKKN